MAETTIDTSPPFQEQFTERVRLSNGATLVEIKPPILSDPVPVLVAPGWSETLNTLKGELDIAFHAEKFVHPDGTKEKGRWVFAVEHPRTDDPRFTNQIDRKADTIDSAIAYLQETEGVKEIDAILHSEAVPNGIAAASHRPDRFRNLVLVNPAGSIGKDSFLNLYRKFNSMIGQDVLRAIRDGKFRGGFTRTAWEAINYFRQNPKLAVKEIQDLAKVDIYASLRDLHALGIGIAIIHTTDDPLFPSEKIKEQISYATQANGGSPIVDQILEPIGGGGHNGLNARPDIHMHQALHALDLLRMHKEVGADKSAIIGDKVIMK